MMPPRPNGRTTAWIIPQPGGAECHGRFAFADRRLVEHPRITEQASGTTIMATDKPAMNAEPM